MPGAGAVFIAVAAVVFSPLYFTDGNFICMNSVCEKHAFLEPCREELSCCCCCGGYHPGFPLVSSCCWPYMCMHVYIYLLMISVCVIFTCFVKELTTLLLECIAIIVWFLVMLCSWEGKNVWRKIS